MSGNGTAPTPASRAAGSCSFPRRRRPGWERESGARPAPDTELKTSQNVASSQQPVRGEASAAARRGCDMSDLGDWFRSIPLITRYWFAGSIAVPLVGKLGLVSPVNLFLWPDAFIHRFQIWRPITATFFFPVGPGTGFLYLVNLYFLYQYSSRLETGAFDGRPADYMFMLLFNWICIVITGLVMDMQLLMIPLIMSVLYVWAQLNRDMIVSFWFGTRFKACYLPWVILGFNYIIGGSVINELIGNLVGHLYFFLMFKYPMDLGGRNFLSTPQFLYRWLPNRRGGVSGFGVPPASMRRAAEDQQGGGRHNWGQGFRLGDQ
uniref:Derlin n=1 Tax=Corvus moneduloides TaxID=1196302 RepID=A0A8C3DL04_CORMO